MFEQSSSQQHSSSIWASVNSWFTPAVFFVLLNVVIGTIAFTSTLSNKKQNRNHHRNEETHDQTKSSVLQRFNSTNVYPYFTRSKETLNSSIYKQTPRSFSRKKSHESLELQSHYLFRDNLPVPQPLAENYVFGQTQEQNRQESQTHFVFEQKDPDLGNSATAHVGYEQKDPDLNGLEQAKEEKIEKENEPVEKSMDEVYSQLTGSHLIRTKADTEPTPGEIPVKLPERMRKSASLKSAFGHFEEEKIVEARRPATVRERRSNNAWAAEGDDEVDARADDFINKFKQQLKLQRLDSITRYKDMVARGSARS